MSKPPAPLRRALWQFLLPVAIVAAIAAAVGGVVQRKLPRTSGSAPEASSRSPC